MVRGYEVVVQLLDRELGGGFVAYAPALTGCVADGTTAEEAEENLAGAIDCWLEYARVSGRRIPKPSETLAPQVQPSLAD